jgi:hypothetical protein
MTDRPTFAEEVRRGFERAQEHIARLEKRFDAVDAELAACRADLAASTARIIQTIAAPWRTNVYTITLERISTGDRTASMATRQVSEEAARAYAEDAIRQSPDAGDLWVVPVEARP